MDNFLPNVKCPYCGKYSVTSISGFGGVLNSREKECRFCHKTFYVNILVETSIDRYTVEDGLIRSMRKSITFLKRQRKLTYAELLIKYDVAKKINKEALRIAVGMRQKVRSN